MATPNAYASITKLSILEKMEAGLTAKLIDAQLEDMVDPAKVSKLKDMMIEVQERALELSEPTNDNKQATVDRNLDKDIRDRVNRIPEFDAKSELALFIRETQTIYDTFVKGNDNSLLETEYVRKLKCRLCQPYLSALTNSGHPVSTFAEFKAYMLENHQSKESHFQHLERLESLQIGHSQNYRDFALQVEELIDQVKTVVKARWENRPSNAHANVKTETSPGVQASSTTMSLDQVFDLFGAMYTLKAVKRDNQTYTAICHDLDACWNSRDIALKAANVADRKIVSNQLTPEPAQIHLANGSHPVHGSQTKRDKGVCFAFSKNGECPKKDCQYTHPKFLRNRTAGNKSGKSGDKDANDRNVNARKPYWKNQKYKKEANVVNANQAGATHADHTYQVPLAHTTSVPTPFLQ